MSKVAQIKEKLWDGQASKQARLTLTAHFSFVGKTMRESPAPAFSSTTSHERQRRHFLKYFLFQILLRNCKSRWPVFLTGYLEKQLEPLTLRPNNWGPKAGRDMREREGTTNILKQETTPCTCILPLFRSARTS